MYIKTLHKLAITIMNIINKSCFLRLLLIIIEKGIITYGPLNQLIVSVFVVFWDVRQKFLYVFKFLIFYWYFTLWISFFTRPRNFITFLQNKGTGALKTTWPYVLTFFYNTFVFMRVQKKWYFEILNFCLSFLGKWLVLKESEVFL